MPRLNMTCPICKYNFGSSHVIQSTYCGHIFHKRCLDDWKAVRQSCPMCGKNFTSAIFDHQLFLDLNDRDENSSEVNYEIELMKTQLLSANETRIQLEDQVKEVKMNFQRLQEQLTTSEQLKHELEQQIGEQKYTEDDFLDLQYECTNSTETIRNLKQIIQEMSMDAEAKSGPIDSKWSEVVQLKTNNSLSDNDTACSESALKSHIGILEQQLKSLNGELEKEIAKSTRLSVENKKLEIYIKAREQNNRSPLLPHNHLKKPENIAAETQKLCLKPSTSDIDNILIIDNFPINHIKYPLKNVIIDLAAQMHLGTISPDDVRNVTTSINSNCRKPQTGQSSVSLFVEFNTNEMIHKFLANKNILKSNPLTRSYILKSVEEDVHSLYLYAKNKLKLCGFTQIFCKNNEVYAKRHRKDKPLQVLNKMHVDDLSKCHTQGTV